MNQIKFPTTGDRILDILLTFSIMDIGLEVDPDIRFEVMLGRENFLSIKSRMTNKELGEEILNKLRDNLRKFSIADKLRFFVNVGNMAWYVEPSVCIYCAGKENCNSQGDCGKRNIPAYAVLSEYTNRAIAMKIFHFPWNSRPISKTVPKKKRDYYATLYVCLLYTSPSPRDRTRSRMPSSA